MILISEKAKERVGQIRGTEEAPMDSFIRVSVTSGGCSGLSYNLEFDTKDRENDQVFEDKGEKIVTDLKSMLYVFGSTLDFSEGLDGKGFFFNNPNASRTCSCGESFSV